MVEVHMERLDLHLVAHLPLVRLLLRHLQRSKIVRHHPQLLLQLKDLGLSNISALLCLLKV